MTEERGAAIQPLDSAQVLHLAELTTHAQKTLQHISLVTSAVFNALSSREAGIKLVQVVNRDDYLAGTVAPVTRLQESGITLPNGMSEKHRRNTSIQPVIVDETGDPLTVGREQRLFTTKQRIALAVRDDGCRRTGCDRPASFCEAHHIDH